MAKKNNIWSKNSTPYTSKYYSRSSKSSSRSWNGRTAHKRISDMIDELDDADIEKFREYYEDLGEDYDKSAKYMLYDVVDQIKKGSTMDAALEKNRLFKGEDASVLKKNKPKTSGTIIL